MITLQIHDVAFGGKGVGRHEGKAVFVPFTLPEETVRVRVVREKKNFAEADLVGVEQPSPDRVEPPCPYFGRCGGCAYQHIAYPKQLALKAAQVEQTLRRVGRLNEVPLQPAIAAPEEYGYRNRIRVHAGGGVVGFFAYDGRTLVDVERCLIAVPEVNEALRKLRRGPVEDGDYSLRAPGGRGPFFEQTNPKAAQALVELVRRTVAPGGSFLVDAYCGAGLFAHALAPLFSEIVGLEENERAIESARRSAAPHERYLHGDVAALLGEVLAAHDASATTVLVDPPATGLSPRVVDLLLGAGPAEIVYVSCNPATLARDLQRMAGPYQLVAVTPLDMFPQTAEIEAVAHLRRSAA